MTDKQHQDEPVAAQVRFRAAAKGLPGFGHGFGPWQEMPLSRFDPKRTVYSDATGYEVETRALYTHADPGEVERKLEDQRREFTHVQAVEHRKWAELVDELRAEVERLREDLRLVTIARDAFDKRVGELQRRVENADLSLRVQTQNCGEMRGEIERRRKRGQACANKVATLRAQLAERDALLRDIDASGFGNNLCEPSAELYARFCAALGRKP